MKEFESAMKLVVQGFVGRITELARRAALDTLGSAFVGESAFAGGVRSPRRGRGRGVKRAPADLAALSGRFLSFVATHPGLRIEQINRQLGTATKDLALPIRKLVISGEIRLQGRRRATKYFAAAAEKQIRA